MLLLIYNPPKSKNAWVNIQIHRMLLLIFTGIYGVYFMYEIQIHRMLLLIAPATRHLLKLPKDSNTSYVAINQENLQFLSTVLPNSNTSYVAINLSLQKQCNLKY